jgi:hypothetical protein
MRLVEVMDRDAAMLAIRDDLVHLADRIRLLRHQRSIKQVQQAERQLAQAQVNAALLAQPIQHSPAS